jgi:hypothetical protein
MKSLRWSSRGGRGVSVPLVGFGLVSMLFGYAAHAGVLSGNCRIAPQPAASLLVPYFVTDMNHPQGRTTVFSVNNSWGKPTLARVVFWTDWGVPTIAFDVYLSGYDVETIDVRDVFNGTLPSSGAAISPVGEYSAPNAAYPGCSGTANPRQAKRQATLDASAVAYLKAAHTGHALPANSATNSAGKEMCAASTRAPGLITGYITIDAVNQCSAVAIGTATTTPADSAYFAHGGSGLASDDNSLWGDVVYIENAGVPSRSMAAIPLVADSDAMTTGSYTFYGRYSGFDGRDDRVPLSSMYMVRYSNETAGSASNLVVWRDTRDTSVSPVACGSAPSWSHMGEEQIVVFDEQENGTELQHPDAFPFATQMVQIGGASLPTEFSSGFVMLDLWKANSTHAQAWVGLATTSGNRFTAGHDAIRADDLCNFGP